MCHTFHTIFNQKLESVSVLVHIEISSTHLSYNVLDIESSIELWTLFELENNLLQMIVTWQNCNNAKGGSKLFGTSQCLFTELKDLSDKFLG